MSEHTDDLRRMRSLPEEQGAAMLEGTVTIAFADVEDSTPLVRRIGDAAFMEVAERISSAVHRYAEHHRALIPRFEGDGWMAVFGSARHALRWAVKLQRFVEYEDPDLAQLGVRIRIGLHTGEAIQTGRDFGGQHVSLASRISSSAAGGQVHVSSVTRTVVEGAVELRFGQPTLMNLKGFDEPQLVHRLDWAASDIEIDQRLSQKLEDLAPLIAEADE